MSLKPQFNPHTGHELNDGVDKVDLGTTGQAHKFADVHGQCSICGKTQEQLEAQSRPGPVDTSLEGETLEEFAQDETQGPEDAD